MIRNKVFIHTIIFLITGLMALQAQTGSVCISKTDKPAHGSALLEIDADDKAVRYPCMDYASADNIDPKYEGLTVFITDEDKKGIYYWEGTNEDGKWVCLETPESQRFNATAPIGSIIMYYGPMKDQDNKNLFDADGLGDENGKMKGWQICNGNNGTPNLSGRFIKGTPDPFVYNPDPTSGDAYGDGNQKNKFTISMDQMYEHDHGFNKIDGTIEPHEHGIPDAKHDHPIHKAARKSTLGYFSVCPCFCPFWMSKKKRKRCWKRCRDCYNSFTKSFIEYTTDGSSWDHERPVEETEITLILDEEPPEQLTFDWEHYTTEPVFFSDDEEKEDPEIDNRPAFGVVVFIMKVDKSLYP